MHQWCTVTQQPVTIVDHVERAQFHSDASYSLTLCSALPQCCNISPTSLPWWCILLSDTSYLLTLLFLTSSRVLHCWCNTVLLFCSALPQWCILLANWLTLCSTLSWCCSISPTSLPQWCIAGAAHTHPFTLPFHVDATHSLFALPLPCWCNSSPTYPVPSSALSWWCNTSRTCPVPNVALLMQLLLALFSAHSTVMQHLTYLAQLHSVASLMQHTLALSLPLPHWCNSSPTYPVPSSALPLWCNISRTCPVPSVASLMQLTLALLLRPSTLMQHTQVLLLCPSTVLPHLAYVPSS